MFNSKIGHLRKNSVYISWQVVFWRFLTGFYQDISKARSNIPTIHTYHNSETYILIASVLDSHRARLSWRIVRQIWCPLPLQKAKDSILPQHMWNMQQNMSGGIKTMERWKKISLTSGLGQYGLPKTRVCLHLKWTDTMNEFDSSDCDCDVIL